MNIEEEDVLLEELSRIHPGVPGVFPSSVEGVDRGRGLTTTKGHAARAAIVQYMKKNQPVPLQGPWFSVSDFRPHFSLSEIFAAAKNRKSTATAVQRRAMLRAWSRTRDSDIGATRRHAQRLSWSITNKLAPEVVEVVTKMAATPYTFESEMLGDFDDFHGIANGQQQGDDYEPLPDISSYLYEMMLFDQLRELQFVSKSFVREAHRLAQRNDDRPLRKHLFDIVAAAVFFVVDLVSHFGQPDVHAVSKKLFRTVDGRVVYLDAFPDMVMHKIPEEGIHAKSIEELLSAEAFFFTYVNHINPHTAFLRNAFSSRDFCVYARNATFSPADPEYRPRMLLTLLRQEDAITDHASEFFHRNSASTALPSFECTLKDALELFRAPAAGIEALISGTPGASETSYVAQKWKELSEGRRFTVGALASSRANYLLQAVFLSQKNVSDSPPKWLALLCNKHARAASERKDLPRRLDGLDILVTRSFLEDSPFWGVLETRAPYFHLLSDHKHTPPLFEWEGHAVALDRTGIAEVVSMVIPEPGSVLAHPPVQTMVLSSPGPAEPTAIVETDPKWIYSTPNGALFDMAMQMVGKSEKAEALIDAIAAAVATESSHLWEPVCGFPYYCRDGEEEENAEGAEIMSAREIAEQMLEDTEWIIGVADGKSDEEMEIAIVEYNLGMSSGRSSSGGGASVARVMKEITQESRFVKKFNEEHRRRIDYFICRVTEKLDVIDTLFPPRLPHATPDSIEGINALLRRALMIYEPQKPCRAIPIPVVESGAWILSPSFAEIAAVAHREDVIDSRTLSNPEIAGSDSALRAALLTIPKTAFIDGEIRHPLSLCGFPMYVPVRVLVGAESVLPIELREKPDMFVNFQRTFAETGFEIDLYGLTEKTQKAALGTVWLNHVAPNGFVLETDIETRPKMDSVSCVSKVHWWSDMKRSPETLFYQIRTKYESLETANVFKVDIYHKLVLSMKTRDEIVYYTFYKKIQ